MLDGPLGGSGLELGWLGGDEYDASVHKTPFLYLGTHP